MKKQAKSRILTGLMTLLLAFSLIVSIPNFNSAVVTAASGSRAATQNTSYGLKDNVQDGVILHAWNWSYDTIKSHLKEIAEAGYTTIQTSPVQQPKDYNASYTNVSGQWWKLYQPVSFSVAQNSWIGNASQLSSLCSEAKQYGIKIICDIVVNHLGNNGNVASLSNEVATYEPTVYNNYSAYIHSYRSCSDGNIGDVVQGNIGMPDLNTSNSYIQGRVISLLEQCIDCGVDGFRFDAAKHIETSSDGEYASNFWDNVIGTATSYAKNQKNISLYCYGEILNTPGNGRSFSAYTSKMSITDNISSNNILSNVRSHNASGASSSAYNTGEKANKLVLWAESHDTYADGSTSGANTGDINRTWAIVASRADAASLYFARTGSASMGQCGSTDFKDAEVSAVNHFHNDFAGKQEYLSSYNQFVMNERYTTKGGKDGGAVIVNVNGGSADVSNMAVNRLGDGKYTDKVTGNTFTVSGGKVSGSIGDTGVAVLYPEDSEPVPTTPANTISQKGGEFTDSLEVTLGLTNATSGTYQVGTDGEVQTYEGSKTITIGKDMKVGESVTVYLTATDGSQTTPAEYTFTKADPDQKETVKVYFSNNYKWDTVYAYYWGGKNPSNAWPGNKMTYVKNNEYNEQVYSIEVPADATGLIFTNGSGAQTADITSGITDGTGFYIKGGSSNSYSVGTYVY